MGTLFVVTTPIGNLADITLRALKTLKEVDLILSEDTRETDKLLKKYNITKSQISYRDQNHTKILPKILALLKQGKSLALTSDSGTPLISDPGFKLVQEVKAQNHNVITIPGPVAFAAAISISGLPTDKIAFLGFLPKKKNQRAKLLQEYGNLDCTLTIYESPFRIKSLLDEIYEVLGNRTICLAKDLTKIHENVETKSVLEFIENKDTIVEKGEYVVLVAKKAFR